MKPPVLYFGAKGMTAERIVSLMPAHDGYVEPYAGSLAVFLATPRVPLEVLNDLDHEIVTFWRVLRERPWELAELAALTPHSRAEFEQSVHRGAVDDLELARRVWVRLTQGRSANLREISIGWRHFADAGPGAFSTFMDAYRNRLLPAAERLLDAAIECRDAFEIVDEYGAKETNLLYVDPPYLGSTRSGRVHRYKVEAADEAHHRELAERLRATAAAVMISGYASDLYDRELYPDWIRHEIPAWTSNAAGGSMARTEIIWSNRELAHGQLDFSGLA